MSATTWTVEKMDDQTRTTDTLNAMSDALFEIRRGDTREAQESLVYAIRQFSALTGVDVSHLSETLNEFWTDRSIPAP